MPTRTPKMTPTMVATIEKASATAAGFSFRDIPATAHTTAPPPKRIGTNKSPMDPRMKAITESTGARTAGVGEEHAGRSCTGPGPVPGWAATRVRRRPNRTGVRAAATAAQACHEIVRLGRRAEGDVTPAAQRCQQPHQILPGALVGLHLQRPADLVEQVDLGLRRQARCGRAVAEPHQVLIRNVRLRRRRRRSGPGNRAEPGDGLQHHDECVLGCEAVVDHLQIPKGKDPKACEVTNLYRQQRNSECFRVRVLRLARLGLGPAFRYQEDEDATGADLVQDGAPPLLTPPSCWSSHTS